MKNWAFFVKSQKGVMKKFIKKNELENTCECSLNA